MKWFKNLRTSVKLISAFLVISVLLAFTGLYGLNNLSRMNDSSDFIYYSNLLPVSQILESKSDVNAIEALIRDVYIDPSEADRREMETQFQALRQKVEKQLAEVEASVYSEEAMLELASFNEAWQAYLTVIRKGMELGIADKDDELFELLRGELLLQSGEVKERLDVLVETSLTDADHSIRDSDELFVTARAITIGVIIGAVLLCVLLGLFISGMISTSLNKVVRLVSKVADGDLRETCDLDSKDEIGKLGGAVDTMVLKLRATVGTILAHSENLAAASQQISASSEEIAGNNANQANSAQAISELFKDLSAAIHSVAQNTETASDLSGEAIRVAREGGEVIRSSMDSMNAVSDQMSRLEEDSQKIGDIIEVIEDIADQTNLLALNAAIEAARAGDQGRGFAVVADEVRKLAERSTDATKQITVIIKGMQQNTNASVSSVQESVDLSRKTGEAFRNIASMVNDAGTKVEEIAAASEEQAAQASNVLTAVESISAATEEAAAASEETATTAQSLAQMAVELQRSVAIFRVDGGQFSAGAGEPSR
ncbi:methyl-accepting chemotaxis protein [Cohnella hongkongensis]|uniref:Methyl-accepting chemotaxis protein n=1 Tax=Cohnella hongkongensis TaxID=178337 RepID=A0ABV9F992_9BACL